MLGAPLLAARVRLVGALSFCCGEWCFRVIVGVHEWKRL